MISSVVFKFAVLYLLITEQFTVKAQGPLIPTWLYKMVASMKATIFNWHCDQMQNGEAGCENIYKKKSQPPSQFCIWSHWQLNMAASMEATILYSHVGIKAS